MDSRDRRMLLQDNSELQRQVEELSQYMELQDGKVMFDGEGARGAGIDTSFVEKTTQVVEVFDAGVSDGKMRNSIVEGLTFSLYGNWCGPGHGGGEAIDGLDECCRKHDRCYEENGKYSCECDKALIRDIAGKFGEMDWKAKMYAVAIVVYFLIAPCNKVKSHPRYSSIASGETS